MYCYLLMNKDFTIILFLLLLLLLGYLKDSNAAAHSVDTGIS